MTGSARSGDVGLLNPAWAGSAAAELCDDTAVLQAMLDVERAWLEICLATSLPTTAPAPAPSAPTTAPTTVRTASRGQDCGPDCSSDHDTQSSATLAASGVWEAGAYDLGSIAARTPLGGNPLIPLLSDLRAQLAQSAPAQAQVVHLGATSQDVIDSALMLVATRVIDDLLPRLDAACDHLATLAITHRDTLCVARSLGQHALPSTFGLRAANWLEGMSAAAADLRLVRAGLPVQWAGAAGTSASLVARLHLTAADTSAAELRARLADRLGLVAAPGWHTTRGPVLRLASALSAVVAAAGTLATDVVTGSRNEIGELAEPVAPGRGGSSAMPHKHNPVLSVTIRSAAMSAPGLLATVATAAGQAADERPDGAWHAEWPALRELLRLTDGVAALLQELTGGLRVDVDALRRNLDDSLPDVLAERAALSRPAPEPSEPDSEASHPALDPAGYLGEAGELVDELVRRHADRSTRS